MMQRQRLKFRRGVSALEGSLFGVIALVLVLAGVAIFRSVDIQHRVANTFAGWHNDKAGYDQALAEQKKSGKPLLVYFYAPWCPYCKEFTTQTLSSPKVQAFVKNYHHVRIAPDLGTGKVQAREMALMEEYGAKSFPSFFVTLRDGSRHQVQTSVERPTPRMKTPDEFIESVKEATGEG